jgi:hypothetical protein
MSETNLVPSSPDWPLQMLSKWGQSSPARMRERSNDFDGWHRDWLLTVADRMEAAGVRNLHGVKLTVLPLLVADIVSDAGVVATRAESNQRQRAAARPPTQRYAR